MAEPDIRHDLTPEEERLAESYFCRRWGEPPATEEMGTNASARPGLHEELDAVDETLKAAYAAVPQSDALVKRVMEALPRGPLTSAEPTTSTSIYVAPRYRRLSWAWGVAGAVAALLFLVACLWLPALRRGLEGPPAQVAKGRVLDASGKEVRDLNPGQTYRVAGTEAVVRVGKDAAVRLLESSRFAVPVAQECGLRLNAGWAYAHSPEQTALRLESDELTADIHGVSLVVQAMPEDFEPGEGMVLVFKGRAHVRSLLGDEELVLEEGQVFTVALGSFVVEPFMATAETTARELEQITGDPAQLRSLRKQYAQIVAGYRRELSSFKKEWSTTADVQRKAELKRRCTLVEQYLKQHRERLKTLPKLGENETPRQRAGRVRRAAEQIERGRKEHSDPHQWL